MEREDSISCKLYFLSMVLDVEGTSESLLVLFIKFYSCLIGLTGIIFDMATFGAG